jgi:hypothetical protein
MKNPKPMSDSRICCRVESLMAQFDVKRHAHQVCPVRLHYVYVSKDRLEICHSNDKVGFESVSIFSTREISGVFITEEQRKTLRECIKNVLKGEL